MKPAGLRRLTYCDHGAGTTVDFEIELPEAPQAAPAAPAAGVPPGAGAAALPAAAPDPVAQTPMGEAYATAKQMALGAASQLAVKGAKVAQRGNEFVKEMKDADSREVYRVTTMSAGLQLGEQAVAHGHSSAAAASSLASTGLTQLGTLLPGTAGRLMAQLPGRSRRRAGATGVLGRAGIDYSGYGDTELAAALYQFELTAGVLQQLADLSAQAVFDLLATGAAHYQLAAVVDTANKQLTAELEVARAGEAVGPAGGVAPFWQAGSSAIMPLSSELARLGSVCRGVDTAATAACGTVGGQRLEKASNDLRTLADKPVTDLLSTVREYHKEHAIERAAAARQSQAQQRAAGVGGEGADAVDSVAAAAGAPGNAMLTARQAEAAAAMAKVCPHSLP